MSIHPSLNTPAADKKQRSVLKRIERLKTLIEKGLWQKGESVFGLPKLKVFKVRVKKEKTAEKPAEGAAADAKGAAATPAKTDKSKAEKTDKK